MEFMKTLKKLFSTLLGFITGIFAIRYIMSMFNKKTPDIKIDDSKVKKLEKDLKEIEDSNPSIVSIINEWNKRK